MVSPVNHIKYNYYDGCGDKLSSTAEWGWVISKLKWPSSDSLRSHYDSGGEYLLNSVVYWCSFDQNKSTNPKFTITVQQSRHHSSMILYKLYRFYPALELKNGI